LFSKAPEKDNIKKIIEKSKLFQKKLKKNCFLFNILWCWKD